MSYEFKKITETEILEEVPEGATALGVVDGNLVQLPGSGLGGGGFMALFGMDASTGAVTCDKTYDECAAAVQDGSFDAKIIGEDSGTIVWMRAVGAQMTADQGIDITFDQGTIYYSVDGTLSM